MHCTQVLCIFTLCFGMNVIFQETEEGITDILDKLILEAENKNHTSAQNDSKVYYFKTKVSPETIIKFLEDKSKDNINSIQNDSMRDFDTGEEQEAILSDTNLNEMIALPDIIQDQTSRDGLSSVIKISEESHTNTEYNNNQTHDSSFESGLLFEDAFEDENNDLYTNKITRRLNPDDNETEIVIDFYSYDQNENLEEMSRSAQVEVQNEKDHFLFDKLTKIKNDIEEIKLIQKQQERLLRKSHNRRIMKTDSAETTPKPPNYLQNLHLFPPTSYDTSFMYPRNLAAPRHHVAIHQTWPIISNGNVLLQRLNYLSNKLIRPPALRVVGK